MRLLEEEGPSGLKARDVAKASNTSAAAIYELFGDKAGLVREIFCEGFRKLVRSLEKVPPNDDPRQSLITTLNASRDFAVANPQLFEVMNGKPFVEFEPDSEDYATAQSLNQLVVRRVSRWLEAEGVSMNPVDAAQSLVAANQGLTAAELAGTLGSSPDGVDRRRRMTIESLLTGLAIEGQ